MQTSSEDGGSRRSPLRLIASLGTPAVAHQVSGVRVEGAPAATGPAAISSGVSPSEMADASVCAVDPGVDQIDPFQSWAKAFRDLLDSLLATLLLSSLIYPPDVFRPLCMCRRSGVRSRASPGRCGVRRGIAASRNLAKTS